MRIKMLVRRPAGGKTREVGELVDVPAFEAGQLIGMGFAEEPGHEPEPAVDQITDPAPKARRRRSHNVH